MQRDNVVANDIPDRRERSKCVVLIRPNFLIYTSMKNPPIGLGYLSAVLEKNGFTTYILDLTVLNISHQTLIHFLKRKQPIFVGITALSTYYSEARQLSRLIKEAIPNQVVVFGGVHATALPENTIMESRADFVVRCEGEETIVELARCLYEGKKDFENIFGITYIVDGKPVSTEDRPLIKDLDALPFPEWHKINPFRYPAFPHGAIYWFRQYAPILTTRGCPYSCKYCASTNFWKNRIRFRSPRNIVDEMEYLVNTFGIKEFHVWDDNFTLKKSHVVGVCREILKRGLKLKLTTPNGIRIDSLDDEVLRWMKAAGFYALTLAVESGSQEMLDAMGKKTKLSAMVENISKAKKIGFYLNTFWMMGFPGETPEMIWKTINLAKDLPVDAAYFYMVQPLPGSELFNLYVKNKSLVDQDWGNIEYHNSPDELKWNALPSSMIKKWYFLAFIHFYFRPYKLVNLLKYRLFMWFHLEQIKMNAQESFVLAYWPRFWKISMIS